MNSIKTMTVFCSAASQYEPHVKLMTQLAYMLAENKIKLVFGGGSMGLMGTALFGIKKAGGEVTGVITHQLMAVELPDPSIYNDGELIKVNSMNERKNMLFDLGDVILVGPGGWGTIDEYSDYAVSVQIGLIKRKPMIFLNWDGFWSPAREMMEKMLKAQTLDESKVDFIEFADTIDDILPAVARAQAKIEARAVSEKDAD